MATELTHLTLSIHTHVQGVVSTRRPVHHGRSALGVEVISFCQTVEGAGLHPPWTHGRKVSVSHLFHTSMLKIGKKRSVKTKDN